MAVDSRDKRATASNIFFLGIGALPDGALDTSQDRMMSSWMYGGIEASSIWTSIIFQGLDVVSGNFVVAVGKYKAT